MADERPQFKFRIPQELFEHLKRQASETDRTVSGYIVHLIRADAAKKASGSRQANPDAS